MSIRIHKLAEELGLDNKEMMALLKERKIIAADVKSVSSTVDNINAGVLRDEFAAKRPAQAAAVPVSAPKAAPLAPESPEPVSAPPKVMIPAGVFVRSKLDIDREKEAIKAAAAAKLTPPVMPPPPVVRPVSAPPVPPRPAPPGPAHVGFVPRPHPLPPPVRPAAPPVVSSPVPPPPMPSAPRPVPAVSNAPKPPPVISAPNTPVMPVQPPAQTATITTSGDVKILHLKPPIIVRDFAPALGMKPFMLISELMAMGIFAAMNQTVEEAIAVKVAEKHGFLLEIKHRGEAAPQLSPKEKETEKQRKAVDDEAKNLAPRPPIVCILGHVDHGKTSLLDAIRKANVAAGEAGGITQHIGAYQVEHNGRKITFLDTPGHAAFNKMRARGASLTDIAVLVVAADDGFMPQTDEALKYIQAAKVTLMVAVNKMDVKGANIDRVKTQMQERSIPAEDWGGETVTVPVSAIKGTGLGDLLDMILLQAEVLELKANPKTEATGIIVESQIDVGRGPLATVIVQRGTLKVGDALVCGPHWCKVRALFDDKGANIKEAPPAAPVRVIGWSGTPESGALFKVVKNARTAEQLAEEAQQIIKQDAAIVQAAEPQGVSVEQLFANIAATQQKTLKVIVKTDVFGSAEAVRNVLEGIKSTKVSLEIVSTEVGLISKNDVLMAGASGAIIIGFNTKLENGVTPLAKHHQVRIETFGIIYELGDKVREMLADLLDPDLKEVKLGAAEVRATFPQGKGFVAGCLVTEGKVTRNAPARLRRGKQIIHEGKVATLKRFKDDANEVRAGLECGIKLDDFNAYETGDIIECLEIQKVRAAL